MSIATVAPAPALADLAVLDPVPDRETAFLLARNFTLPLLLDRAAPAGTERQEMIEVEVARLTALLVGRGFLQARIETSGSATEGDPLRLTPVPGPRFRIGEVRIDGLPPQADAALRTALEALRERTEGGTALRSAIDDLRNGILFELRQASYADAALGGLGFDLDPRAGIADLVVTVDPGLPVRFGEVAFRGSLRMDAAEARTLVPFRTGDPYSIAAVDGLKAALDGTGLFRRIRIETEAAPDAPGVVNLSVRLWDRAQLPQDGAPPRVLLATILMLAVLQTVRMTARWSNRTLRLALIVPAVLMIGGSAVEVTHRLYWFLSN